jgi:ADP-ribose pyrophosphatase YjhB (NUDIX family)
VATVDLVVRNSKLEILLLRRNRANSSWKRDWATPGGRILKRETVIEAAHRVLLRETGIQVKPENFAYQGFVEIITPRTHGITHVFSASTTETKVTLDNTSSSFRWFLPNALPRSLRKQYRQMIDMSR